MKEQNGKNVNHAEAPQQPTPLDFPIVGIGASAGGLTAFETFFDHVPPDSGMAFVLVQHLSAQHQSILAELIRRHSCIAVSEIKDGVQIQPNHAYIIPPGKNLALLHSKLHLMTTTKKPGPHLTIDYFFRSLAQDQQERAIGVVLSGTGSDGTLGLRAIKEKGGMAMAQDPETADYDGMPRSAIATGLVDYILPPAEMPQQLLTYVEHIFRPGKKPIPSTVPETNALQKVFIVLRAQTGHDFSYYKKNTIHRRLERRMAINQIKTLDHYVDYLRQNPLEVTALFQEILITVTNFFRDPEAFATLETQVIPRLLKKPMNQPIRIWVPGCATGEEAYSIAILLREQMEQMRKSFKVQIFATDLDKNAIETAREGVYPQGIAADISPERLTRFFTQQSDTYHIHKTIRDMLIFAEQNLIGDPPFSRIDLISCRNLLIYIESEMQKKILPLFHYALQPRGFLFLGASESIGKFTDLFATVNGKQKIFQRKETTIAYRPFMIFPASASITASTALRGETKAAPKQQKISIREVVEQFLLQHHTPACAIVDEKGKVLYFHGHTGKYPEPAPGKATLNILRMAREGLRIELTTALRKALAQKVTIRYPGLNVKTNGDHQTIHLTVKPMKEPPSMRGLLMVLFEDVTPPEKKASKVTGDPLTDKDQYITQLERELQTKEEYLQTTIEELETSNEELTSTNEELQSANEELQSANEELETSKEEAQSINEELRTVNVELEQKVEELTQTNDDIKNLLSSTGVSTLFLDEDLHIQRFTPAAAEVLNLIQSDVERPVRHITSNLVNYDNLAEDAQQVLDTLIPQDHEVQTEAGMWYLLRIRPYRTLRNVIKGVVITFIEITERKRAEQEVKAARDYAENIIETIHEPLVILNADLRVVSANRAFYQTYQMAPENAEGKLLYNLGDKQWDIPPLRKLLEEILPEEAVFNGYEVTHNFHNLGQRTMLLNAREVQRAESKTRFILLAIEDITER